jgi:hypothetical protein
MNGLMATPSDAPQPEFQDDGRRQHMVFRWGTKQRASACAVLRPHCAEHPQMEAS